MKADTNREVWGETSTTLQLRQVPGIVDGVGRFRSLAQLGVSFARCLLPRFAALPVTTVEQSCDARNLPE